MSYWEYMWTFGRKFAKKKSTSRLSDELGSSKDSMHRRLRQLENHAETVDLYLMSWHLNRLNMKWISVVSLLVIPWMIDLSGELSHMMKSRSIIATLMPRNSGSVTINLPKSSFKKSVQPQSPDAAPSDYHLFQSMAHFLRGRNSKNFETDE